MLILYGHGKNGKSVFCDTVSAMMGDYATETPAETLMIRRQESSNSNDIARLVGARWVSANETEEGHRMAESKVKALTGGDVITARFLHREFFEFKPEFKLWLRTNHKPQIRGTDEGIWRRLRLVQFGVTIPEEERDPKLGEKLLGELPGILAWAVQGCLAWQREGLRAPAEVELATSKYRVTQDIIAGFLVDKVARNRFASTSVKDLYNAYVEWCDESGERPLTKRHFGERMQERGFYSMKTTGGMRVYEGLRLTVFEDANDESFDEVARVAQSGAVSGISPENKNASREDLVFHATSCHSRHSEEKDELVI
jgi:putative DNA primase/helicase